MTDEETEAQVEEAEMEIQIDPHIAFSVLKKVGGNLDKARLILKTAGWQGTKSDLRAFINSHPVLAAFFREGGPIVHDNSPDDMEAMLLPRVPTAGGVGQDELAVQMADSPIMDRDYIAAKGLEGIGFKPGEIERVQSLAQFANKGFASTIDYAYGNMIANLFRISEEAERIRKNILQNNDLIERHHVTEAGAIVRFQGPKYTEEEKIYYQKEYRMLLEEARKVSEAATQAGAIRIKAQLQNNAGQPGAHLLKKAKRVK